jgi:hypothetical protein
MKLVLLFVSVFAVQASAGVPFLSFAKKSHKIKNALPCTDFTGKWEGMCTHTDSQGTSQGAAELEIEMWSCNNMLINNHDYPLGGSKVESNSNKNGTRAYIVNMEWNDNAKMEHINYTHSSKQVLFDNPVQNDVNGSGTLKISASKLILVEKVSEATTNCDFSKK